MQLEVRQCHPEDVLSWPHEELGPELDREVRLKMADAMLRQDGVHFCIQRREDKARVALVGAWFSEADGADLWAMLNASLVRAHIFEVRRHIRELLDKSVLPKSGNRAGCLIAQLNGGRSTFSIGWSGAKRFARLFGLEIAGEPIPARQLGLDADLFFIEMKR